MSWITGVCNCAHLNPLVPLCDGPVGAEGVHTLVCMCLEVRGQPQVVPSNNEASL